MKLKSELIPKAVKVSKVHHESHDTITLTLDQKIAHKPGQFMQVNVLGIGESPISISSYSSDHIQLSIRNVGNVTRALNQLKKGDQLFIRGPYGNGYPLKENEGKNVILIGGGCGVAPLKGAIDYLDQNLDKYNDIQLFLGFHSPKDILFRNRIKQWEKRYKTTIMVDTNPVEYCYMGSVGFITEGLEKAKLHDPKNTIVLMCGPTIMMKTAIDILVKKHICYSQIFLSTERLMYCAIGQCCHCMVKGKFCCTDGPVFCYEDLVKDKND